MKKLIMLLIAVLMVAALAACGSGETNSGDDSNTNTPAPVNNNNNNNDKPKNEVEEPLSDPLDIPDGPVELLVYNQIAFNDNDFALMIENPVKEQYPHVSFKRMWRWGQGNILLSDLLATGTSPDILITYQGNIPEYVEMDLVEDIEPLLKKHNIDLTRFEQPYLDALRVSAKNNELYGLPYGVNFSALYYNKDIFDLFGVNYPKDGMTWEEATALAKDLSRTHDGVQYRGLDPESVSRVAMSLSLGVVNPDTNKSILNTDPWKLVFETVGNIYRIPGNEKPNTGVGAKAQFLNERTLAMFAQVNIINDLAQDANRDLNWDVAQYPSFAHQPNVYGSVDAHYIVPTKTTKYKDLALQIAKIMTSDEVQMVAASQTARLTPLKNEEVKKAFAASLNFNDKSLASIWKGTPAPYNKPPLFDGNGGKHRDEAFNKYLNGELDLNSALREAEEKHNQELAAQLAGQ